jgi:hypothetical protein
MTLPYENTPEFIQSKAEVQERFLQATPNRAGQTAGSTLEACCRKLREMAELHRFCLDSRSDRRGYLRAAINRECRALFGPAGPDYPELKVYCDSLLREMVGDTVDVPGKRAEAELETPEVTSRPPIEHPPLKDIVLRDPIEPEPEPTRIAHGPLTPQTAGTSSTELPTVSDIEAALNAGDRKKAVELRRRMDTCNITELWTSAFRSRGGKDRTKQTAFNRWQASRQDAPSWADPLIRARLLRR